jgi:hypothetical protein
MRQHFVASFEKFLQDRETLSAKYLARGLIYDDSSLRKVLDGLPVNLQGPLLQTALGEVQLKKLIKRDIASALAHDSIINIVGRDYIRSCVNQPALLRTMLTGCEFTRAVYFIKNVLGREHLIKIFATPEDVCQFNNPIRSTLKSMLNMQTISYANFFSPVRPRPVATPVSSPALSGASLGKS